MSRITVGIDIGTESTKVNLGASRSCEIVRTASGGHTTPTAVSFSGNMRQIGETASLKGKNSVIHLNRLIRGQMEEKNDIFEGYYMFDRNKDDGKVTVDYNGSNDPAFEPAALIAMLLGKAKKNAYATIERVSESSDADWNVEYFLSVPPGASKEAREDLLDAAYAAGMGQAKVIESSDCYGSAYQRKFPEHMDGRTILIVDMGHSSTSVLVLRMGNPAQEEADKEAKEDAEEKAGYTVLSSVTHKSLGGGSVDIRLWHHFQSEIPALKEVSQNSRAGQRLLDGSKKLKHLLSQLPEGSVTVENVGANDTDLKIAGTCAMLADVCQADKATLLGLISKAIEEAKVESVTAVEVLGGGCRIPWVKDTILESVGNKDISLSHSLDDTSAALGAALIGEAGASVDVTPEEGRLTDRREHLVKDETAMATLDEDMHVKADMRNKIEAHVLEMRSAKHNTHGKLLPDTLDAYLDETEDWLFSDEAENSSKQEMSEKLEETLEKIKELCKDYLEAVKKENEAKDREMEEEAKKAQKERSGEEGDEEDHDNRRLPKKRRMEIVMKNKAEANELFSDGNHKFAAARYTKALSHCAKFVDLSPEDTEEVNAVKLSLNLNLALAYTKLENLDQALRVCNDAIAIDENSPKALYRRASIFYEKKRWDDAKKDAKKAASIVPDDKATKKLGERIDLMMKRQKAKEKKMAQKMFS